MTKVIKKNVLLSSMLVALGLSHFSAQASSAPADWESHLDVTQNADKLQSIKVTHKGGYVYDAVFWNHCFVPEQSKVHSTNSGVAPKSFSGVVQAGTTLCSTSYMLKPMLGAKYTYQLKQCGEVNITTKGTTGYPRANISYSDCLEQEPDMVAMYQHCNYNGNERFYPAGGDVDLRDLEDLGLSNDSISSIRVPAGYKVIIYKHGDFSGTSKTLLSDVSCLNTVGMNDQLSSFKVRAIGVGAYQYQNMTGGSEQSATFTPDWYTKSAMEAKGMMNDTLSALHVPEGFEVEVYEHDDFTGDFRTLSAGFSGSLADLGFNNKTSSMIVREVN